MMTEIDKNINKKDLPIIHEGQYIEFRFVSKSNSEKTDIFAIFNKNEELPIAIVSWIGRWRKYGLTVKEAIFEEVCLREIADFIQLKTKEHKGLLS